MASEFDFRLLFLIPLTLAEAFLIWALWQLQKQLTKGAGHPARGRMPADEAPAREIPNSASGKVRDLPLAASPRLVPFR